MNAPSAAACGRVLSGPQAHRREDPAGTAADAGIRFDWYAASFISWDDFHLVAAGSMGLELRTIRGANGYPAAWELFDGEGVQMRAMRRDGDDWHAEIHGSRCADHVPIFRRLVPRHNVSRADAALDYLGDFSAIGSQVIAWADAHGVSWRRLQNSTGGQTVYVGAASSAAMIRVYDKTAELRDRGVKDVQERVVRVELQLRPRSEHKALAAGLSAREMWGYTRTTRRFLEDFAGQITTALELRVRKPTSLDRAVQALGAQYANTASKLREEMGDAAAAELLLDVLGFGAMAVTQPQAI